jgi:hypothetical protein
MLATLRGFFGSRSIERAFYLAGFGDALIVVTVVLAVAAVIAKLVK